MVGETGCGGGRALAGGRFQYPRRIEWWVRPRSLRHLPYRDQNFQYPRRIEWWVRLLAPLLAVPQEMSFSILGGSSGG